MRPIKFLGSRPMTREIIKQLHCLMADEEYDLIDQVLFDFNPEESDGSINFCLFMTCYSIASKLRNFPLFVKRVEQALKNRGEMALVRQIQILQTTA